MAEGEATSIVIAAGLVGGVVGAVLTAFYSAYRGRILAERAARRDAIAQWLAAWITLGRASVSFVAAFRSLAAQPPASRYFGLRQEESQRARAQWCRAAESLDLAAAMVRVWIPSSMFQRRLDGFERVSVESLRTAIDGDEVAVDRLVQTVLSAERRAISLAETAAHACEPLRRVVVLRRMWSHVVKKLEAVTDGWSKYDS